MHLLATASSFPDSVYTQADCFDAVRKSGYWTTLSSRSLRILETVLTGDNGIQQRHFAVDSLAEAWQRNAQELNEAYEREAPRLGTGAVTKALEKAGLEADQIDVLLVSTCTGYLCPGLSSHIAEGLGARSDVFTQDLTGHGCGAALPLVQIAAGYAKLYPNARIVTAQVEVCSAAFFLDDDVGVLISACLFGDGASAQVWASEGGLYRIDGFESVHLPDKREELRFVNHGGKLRNRLRKTVPSVVAASVSRLLSRYNPALIGHPVLHGGGRDVLDALLPVFPGTSLERMREVLRQCGNLSSPSLFVALERELASGRGECRDYWLCGFGAGFSAHAAQLRRTGLPRQ